MSGSTPTRIPNAFVCFALALIGLPAAILAEDKDPSRAQATFSVRTEMVPMRDRILLATDLVLPSGRGPFPAIVVRNPYSLAGKPYSRELASLGYVLVVQDCRGTGRSQGEWEPFSNETRDGVDTQKWVVKQTWCNGKIATAGGSYLGYTQWAIAHQAEDSLKAMFTEVPAFSFYEVNYVGGAFRANVNLFWNTVMCRPGSGQKLPIDVTKVKWDHALRLLPLRTWDEQMGIKISWLRDSLAHPEFDEYWARSSATGQLDKIAVPNLTCTGWYDVFLDQALRYLPALRKVAASDTARRHQHLIIGPWGHTLNQPVGELSFGSDAKIDLEGVSKQWSGYWLKGEATGVDKWPFLRIFVMGTNRWRDENEWPLARTRFTPYYFHSGGSGNTLNGNGKLRLEQPTTEPPDRYVYDPKDPVPTHGGEWNFLAPCGSLDQRQVESRKDVLVYTSDELAEPLEVTGPVKVVLHAASSAPDTDWTAKLVDVHPDGRAFNLCDGILRARYRESLTKAKLLEPGKIYRYEIDLSATSNVFLSGHRIRVDISSCNFPRFDRNPNTGHPLGADAELKRAEQTVYHAKERASHILLPVIPR